MAGLLLRFEPCLKPQSTSCFISTHQTPGPVSSVPLSTGSSSCCRPSASPDLGGPFLPSRVEALWPSRPYNPCPAQLSRAGLATAQDTGPIGPRACPPQPCAPCSLMRHLLSDRHLLFHASHWTPSSPESLQWQRCPPLLSPQPKSCVPVPFAQWAWRLPPTLAMGLTQGGVAEHWGCHHATRALLPPPPGKQEVRRVPATALALSAQQGFVFEAPRHGCFPPRRLALCPRQLGSLAQLPELPLTAMFGCGPTGTSVPSQAVGIWADGREGRKMLLLGSPSPSRCHLPTCLPPPPESLGWPSRRNRQTFKDGLGTLFQK